jgi:hypothetical protein
MSLETILRAANMNPRDRERMLTAAKTDKVNVVPIPVHLVRECLNKSRIGHTTLVEKIIEALQTAQLVEADETA